MPIKRMQASRWGYKLPAAVLAGVFLGYGLSALTLSSPNSSKHKILAEHVVDSPAPALQHSAAIGLSIQPPELNYQGHEGPHVCKQGPAKGLRLEVHGQLVSPVVLVAHNRVHYLAKAMLSLLTAWKQNPSNQAKFPLFVSVDGEVQRTLLFATAWQEAAGVQVLTRVQNSTQCNDAGCNLTGHYKMLLQVFFNCLNSPRLLFLEEDLEVALDFFSYFEATSPLLDQDPSLWCISAWNDNGQRGRASNSTALYRTDILPGLGWMISKKHGSELAAKWPERDWDEWMRREDIRKSMQCIFPEVPRTHTFGKIGAHGGLYYDEYLAIMVLNNEHVDWSKQDLSYLLKDKYAATMKTWLSSAVEFDEESSLAEYCNVTQSLETASAPELVVTYDTLEGNGTSFVRFSEQLKPMMGGIVLGKAPKASYHGIVVVRCRGRRLFLQPKDR